MLVLTRRIGEDIVIGENSEIKITVLHSDHGKVRLGFDAPKNVQIFRSELLDESYKIEKSK